ncbi:MAG: UDP-N-acetylmuramoyl-tripeptide--D-alanyl-D-alanine ligase [Candidatus Latescibacteria bacterium]|nr:UDP-N-acetylmuramoyl-tripeptide--D-alanyl-D-alanine ligase [Candidatus Latescibacterota bacterium]
MEGIGLRQIQQWTNGEFVGIFDPQLCPIGVSTDSRTVRPGELFAALKGPVFDGHNYVEQALAQGACAALVEASWGGGRNGQGSGPLLYVPDTLEALGQLARQYRQTFSVPVVGVVGSAGKTTTKEMIAAVLGQRYKVLKPQGSYNNEIGVPLTLLQLDRYTEAVVLELAARKCGDISYLCTIAAPTIGVLLNIGTAHLELFGSVERVAKAKGEILEYLDESSLALVNFDDCVVAKEVQRTKGRLLGFSLERESHTRGEGLVLDQGGCGHFSLQNYTFDLQVPGRHNVYNALAAAAVGRALEVPWVDIQTALDGFRAVPLRSEVEHRKGLGIINDTYNANPESVRAALDLLGALKEKGGKIAVLGDMLELGPEGARLHAEVGRYCAELGLDALYAAGPLSQHTVEGASQAGLSRARHFASKAQLVAFLQANLSPGDLVLVKASRGQAFEEVAAQLGR